MKWLTEWLKTKWQPPKELDEHELRSQDFDVQLCFGTDAGQRVLYRLFSDVYCAIAPRGDEVYHEGRRSVVQEILESLNRAEKQDYGRGNDDNSGTDTAE